MMKKKKKKKARIEKKLSFLCGKERVLIFIYLHTSKKIKYVFFSRGVA